MSERFGIRMKVLGKTRSGKSTALYRLIAELVPLRWSKILILDGKRDTLKFSAEHPNVQFFNSTNIAAWDKALAEIAAGMNARYEVQESGGDPAPVLIVADEIQAGTRDQAYRVSIKNSLMLISEQSAALGDCIILASQRAANAIPPAVTNNCNCSLTMLGYGYFHFTADEMRAEVGRSQFIDPEQAAQQMQQPNDAWPDSAELTPRHLMQMLAPQIAEPKDGRLILYTGEAGSGLTHNLMSYSRESSAEMRVISVNVGAETHKSMLIEMLSQCSAACPPKSGIPELSAMAALAIGSKDTLLLLDNLHGASPKTHASIQHVISFASETVATFATPVTSSAKIRAFEWYIARGQRTDIEPLTRSEAEQLALVHMNEEISAENRSAAARRVAQVAQGHAKTVVAAARRIESGELEELRTLEGRKSTEWSFLWLGIAAVIVVVALNAQRYNAAAISAIFLVIMLIGRRLLSRSLSTVLPRR